jgi:hypothetical protein
MQGLFCAFICGVDAGYDRSDVGYDWLMARYDHFENDVPFFIPK